jgi:hypothetical protein
VGKVQAWHLPHRYSAVLRWSRLFEQFFRVDKWNLCRG